MRPSAVVPPPLLYLSSLSFLLALTARPAAAQTEPSVDVRGFRASADPNAGLYLEPASSPGSGDFSAALWLSYGHRPIALQDPSTEEVRFDVIGHQLSADLAACVGLAERAAVGLDLPVLLSQGGDERTPEALRVLGASSLPGQALGDLGVTTKLTAVKPTLGTLGGFGLALHQRFTVPTGNEASYMGEGAMTSETRVLAEYRLVAVGLHLATGVKLRAEEAQVACADQPAGDAGCPTRFGHELPFGVGLTVKPQAFGIDGDGRVTLFLEAHGYLPLAPIAPFESSRVAAAQLGLGARYALGDVSILGGVEAALVGGVGNPPLRAMASIAWAPRVKDADGDGVPDEADACRELAEDRDGFQDSDGCPEGDNDEDGVVDEEDRCPGSQEDEDGFEDEDGCLDPDPDPGSAPEEATP